MSVVIYFSRAGENLIDGSLKTITEGNTAVLAQKIAEKLEVDHFQINPTTAYPVEYEATVLLADREKRQQIRPEIESLPIHLEEKKIIFLGFPNWWGTFPMPVASFLETGLLDGKTIYPFCTHEGSGFGNSLNDLKKTCPTSEIKTGLHVRGSRVQKADTAVRNWLSQYDVNNEKRSK